MKDTTNAADKVFRVFPWRGPEMAIHEIRAKGGLFMAVNLPWDMVAPHEEQARKNHRGQSLEQLNGRGGLHAGALVAILEGREETDMTVVEANMRLVELWTEFERAKAGVPTA